MVTVLLLAWRCERCRVCTSSHHCDRLAVYSFSSLMLYTGVADGTHWYQLAKLPRQLTRQNTRGGCAACEDWLHSCTGSSKPYQAVLNFTGVLENGRRRCARVNNSCYGTCWPTTVCAARRHRYSILVTAYIYMVLGPQFRY